VSIWSSHSLPRSVCEPHCAKTLTDGRLGFIVGNVPGAVAGAALGNRLGAIRDAKGKSVAQVFTTLDAGAKAEVSVLRGRV